MKDEPILITNGDIYHTVNLREMYLFHQRNGHDITLGMHDFPRFNTVSIEGDRVTAFKREQMGQTLAYTGLQVIEPKVLRDIQENRYSCIIDHYRVLLEQGHTLHYLRVDGCHWTDMGTVDDYLALHEGLLTEKIPCWQEIGTVRKPYCIAKRAKLPAQLELEDWVCIGEARIGNKSHLQRCVVWDDVVVHGGMEIVNSIVSSDI
jgi:mannose-1-phosphate guanylyltransferase